MPTQRKPTPRKAAYKAADLPTSKVETDRRIPLIVLAVIAAIMAIVLVFTQCNAPAATEQQSSMPAIGEPAVESSDATAEQEAAEEIEAPENPSARASLNDYSWEELSQISSKISAAGSESDAIYVAKQYGLVDANGKLNPSATKSVSLGDGTTVQVRIIGLNHDTASDGSGKAGLTFMFSDGVSPMAYNEDGSNYGGWASSSVSYSLYANIYSSMPSELTEQIVEVSKAYNTGAADSVSESNDVIWLPSYIEVAGSIDSSMVEVASTLQQEGSQYKLFADSGVTGSGNNSVLVMHSDGQATSWWLRSADVATEDSWCYVNPAGHPTNGAPANQEYLLVPCFCI